MGQYFVAINVTKKEYVDPWSLGGFAKLWEWCVNRCAGIFPYLLRKSSRAGGGDIATASATRFAGRWAGDCVYLIGDYDNSALFETAQQDYTNISTDLVKEYNDFMEVDEFKLKPFHPKTKVTSG